MSRMWGLGGVAVIAVLFAVRCGGSAGTNINQSTSSDGGTITDGGTSDDAGTDDDAGTPVDGGSPTDAGPLPVNIPNIPDWTFYGPANGGPNKVFGASKDEGGNLWVAGGEEGLFVLRAGESTFQRFTMDDGLRPYGYMQDGSEPPGEKYLKVISVSGGPAGVAYVGYEGKPPKSGEVGCEDNWDGPSPDPAIYKSGDADKVTLNGAGISVAHYDIWSGMGIVGGELRGREKLCSIYRIRYDKLNNVVWFGGNHGFALGAADYQGTGNCQWYATPNPPVPTSKTDPFSNEPGHFGCSGVTEHVHPALNGYKSDGVSCCAFLTGGYYGVSVDPLTGDTWFGGQMRTTKFKYASSGRKFYTAQGLTENSPHVANRIDVWPDRVTEPQYPKPSDREDDFVSGAAALPDGSVWLSSFQRGLARLDSSGAVTTRLSTADGLASNKVFSIAADPLDGSIWAGTSFAGVSRLRGGSFTNLGGTTFGHDLTNQRIVDIQSFGSGGSRQMIFSFGGSDTKAGAVGVYTGQ